MNVSLVGFFRCLPSVVRAVVVASAGAVLFSGQAIADARPIFSMPEMSYDFGTVAQGAVVTHEFPIKNSGTADLVIQRIAPSCGCTATSIPANVIKPGVTEKVKVSFDTSGFFGRKTKTVLVVTNDLDSPEKVFALTGSITAGYTVEPTKVEFGDISSATGKAARVKEISIKIADGGDLKVTKVASLSPFLKISPVETRGESAVVNIELAENTPKGEFRDRVIFDLDGGRQSSINVPVTASIKGDIRVTPTTVSFGVMEGSQVIERRVQFENKASAPVTITSITSSDAAVSASLIPVQRGRHEVVVVKVDPTKLTGDLKATLDIKTDHPTEGLVSVNVFAVKSPK